MITAVLISRDNEDTIETAIESVLPVSKQIVLVDTGSMDKTPQIAGRLGCEVHFMSWQDDFSLARNHALAFARQNWILSIDTDERLPEEYYDDLLNLPENPETGGLNVELVNVLEGGSESRHRYTRIFRNHPGIKYRGRIHEQIRPSIEELGLDIIESDISIEHYGYEEPGNEKKLRNKNLLLADLEDDPGNGWIKYHLGQTEFALNNFHEAENYFRVAINSRSLDVPQTEMALLRLGQIALKKGDVAEIDKLLNFRSNDIHREGLRLFVKAACHLERGEYGRAITIYRMPELRASSMVDSKIVDKALSGLSGLV
jgi:glycosyltransferase involved in cell wall biosynthesis